MPRIPKNERCARCKGTGRRPEGPRKKTGPKPKIDPAQVIALRSEGVSVINIAAQLGVTSQSIYRLLRA